MDTEERFDNLCDRFGDLRNKMRTISKTSFHASTRLKVHAKYSAYTIILVCLGLLALSLMQAYSVGGGFDAKDIGLIQSFYLCVVMVYSFLLYKKDYAGFSAKMDAYSSQFFELEMKVIDRLFEDYYSKLEQLEEKNYLKYEDEYNSLLKLYEESAIYKFRGDYYRAQLELPEFYDVEVHKWLALNAKAIFWNCLNFISYPVVLVSLGWVIFTYVGS